MVLAMIAVLGPAVGRILILLDVRTLASVIQPLVAAVFISWCLIHDWRKNHVVHPVFAVGGFVIVASWPIRTLIAGSEWWHPIGAWIAQVGASV
jgi:hypothetical protein